MISLGWSRRFELRTGAGVARFRWAATSTSAAPLPPISGSLTIEGGGHTVSGNDEFRIFDVNGGTLTLKDVALTEGNAGEGRGGAIHMRNGAAVMIERATFSANMASHGGAIATSGGRLTIGESKFMSNIADQSAGAIYASGGSVNISDSRFEKNCATSVTYLVNTRVADSDAFSVDADGCPHVAHIRGAGDHDLPSKPEGGGAIRLLNGARAAIENSVFSDNRATYGGALAMIGARTRLSVSGSSFVKNGANSGGALGASWTGGGSVTIRSSSFVENSAHGYSGGAIEAVRQKLDIANSTFSKNYAAYDGGALVIHESSEATITHATFVENSTRNFRAKAIGNTGGKAYLRNSIITSSSLGEDCVGVWEQNAGNISPDGTCAERPGDDPRLGELTGAPSYYPLRDRSPAIDYADPEYCLEADQAGAPRPQGGGCEIGAIEAQGAIAAEPTPVPPVVCTLAFQIVAANHDRPAGGCPAGRGVDTIVLDKDITLFEPLPPITSHIVIEGNGHSISGNRRHRIFDVDGGRLTIANLTLTGGFLHWGGGGAIRLRNKGQAAVSDSRFINNEAQSGGAIYIDFVGAENSWLRVDRSSFVGNRGWQDGGAIYSSGGDVTVKNSSFVDNVAFGYYASGAIHISNRSGLLTLDNSSFINNGRSGISADSGAIARLTHLTIYGSHPAIIAKQDHIGAAITLYLRNSVLSGELPAYVCDRLRQNIGNLIAGRLLFAAVERRPDAGGSNCLVHASGVAAGKPGDWRWRRALL